MRPYLGFNFQYPKQACVLRDMLPDKLGRQILVNVRTKQYYLTDRQTDAAENYLSLDAIKNILLPGNSYYNVVRYHSHKIDQIHLQITPLLTSVGANLHGVELDMVWPTIGELQSTQQSFLLSKVPDLIITVSEKAFNRVGRDVRRLAARLSIYEGVAQAFMLRLPTVSADGLRIIFDACSRCPLRRGCAVEASLFPTLVDGLLTDFPLTNVEIAFPTDSTFTPRSGPGRDFINEALALNLW